MGARYSQVGRKAARARLSAGPCAWCQVWCDPALPYAHPRKATWDHLIPQSAQPAMGYRDRSNLVRACHTCNSRRGNRDPSVMLNGADNLSREW